MLKKITFIIMTAVLLFNFGFSSSAIAQKNGEMDNGITPVNLEKVKNLEEVFSTYTISEKDVTSSYSMSKDDGVINLYDSTEDIWINLYVSDNLVEFQSIQKELVDGNVSFELFSKDMSLVISEVIKEDGSLVNHFSATDEEYNNVVGYFDATEIKDNDQMLQTNAFAINDRPGTDAQVPNPGGGGSTVNSAAVKWACIFSSYLACIGVAGAAGAAGTLVSGPFGLAAGFAGGAACRYVFQTLVERYGSKDLACKIFG